MQVIRDVLLHALLRFARFRFLLVLTAPLIVVEVRQLVLVRVVQLQLVLYLLIYFIE